MQCAYSCFFTRQAPKLPLMAIFTWFLILRKIQDSDHCWWHHRPPAAPPPIKYTSSCSEDQRLSTEGNIVSKYCNISKTLGRGSIDPPPPPNLYQGGCMNLRVRPRINLESILNKKGLDEVNWQLAFVFPPPAPIQTLKTGASLLSFQTIPCVHKSHLFPARLGNGQQCSNATLFCTQNQSLNHHLANGYYVICHVTYLEGYPRGSPSPTIYLFSKGRVYLNDCTIHNPF